MTHFHDYFRFRLFVSVGVLCGVFAGFQRCVGDDVFAAIPRYNVTVAVSADKSVATLPAILAELPQQLKEKNESLLNNLFDISVVANEFPENGAAPTSDADSVGALPKKTYFVRYEQFCTALSIREYDHTTRFIGAAIRLPISDPTKYVDATVEAICRVFSPLGLWVRGSDSHISVKIIASDRMNIVPFAEKLKEGTVLLPYIQTVDAAQNVLDVSQVPLTAFVVEKREKLDELAHVYPCRVESAFRSSLTVRRRGRTNIYGLAVPNEMQPTILRIEPRIKAVSKQSIFLPPYQVFDVVGTDEEGKPLEVLLGQTDRDGCLAIQPVEERRIQKILVRSGNVFITRFPLIRGISADFTVPIADDPIRLEAEAYLIGLQERWLDQLARASILRGRVDTAEKAENANLESRTRNELTGLRSRDQYLFELQQARSRFPSRDNLVERRINKMFADTKKFLEKE